MDLVQIVGLVVMIVVALVILLIVIHSQWSIHSQGHRQRERRETASV